jgi:hypothetical protein
MTASFLHYISLFLSVFFVTNKMRLPCRLKLFWEGISSGDRCYGNGQLD